VWYNKKAKFPFFMNITPEEVDRIAKLARLNFDQTQKKKLQEELSSILDYVGQLKSIESKVPLAANHDPAAVNLMRDDVVVVTADPEEFLAQSPDRQGNFVKVKSILE